MKRTGRLQMLITCPKSGIKNTSLYSTQKAWSFARFIYTPKASSAALIDINALLYMHPWLLEATFCKIVYEWIKIKHRAS